MTFFHADLITVYILPGNELARTLHIALNVINLALFAWQVPTGIEIMLKVWKFTSWP
jgi:hypothetical protein